jgi:hypothetical protein
MYACETSVMNNFYYSDIEVIVQCLLYMALSTEKKGKK